MPHSPPRACILCHGKHRQGETCPRRKARERVVDQERGSAASRGYGRNWRKLRAAYLSRLSEKFKAVSPMAWGRIAAPLREDGESGTVAVGVPCAEHARSGEIVAATVVDHIRPHQGRDDPLYWDQNNWQPLCSHCHAAKSAREGTPPTRRANV